MLTFVDLYFIINIKVNYVYLQWFADFMLTNLWRKKMDNYNNNGYNNDSWNNPQGNGPDPQQNNYSNQGYQQPFPFPPIREIPLQQRVKARPVVHFLDMAQLMDHHKVNGLHGASHEVT